MRLAIVLHIFRKDLVETLRDRRTVVMAFLVPALIYPLLFTLLGSVATDKRGELERTRARVAAWGPVPASTLSAVEQHARADIVDRRDQPPADPEAEARKLVAARKVHVVLLTPPGASGASIPIRVLADSTDVDSDAMERRVSRALTDQGAELLRQRMTALGQDASAARPLDIKEEDLADAARRGSSFAAALLPYLLLVLLATSGFYAALDLTAGEKERGTLQTLLTAPVRSVEIVAGKYLAVLALTLAATLCNLGSIALTLSRATAAMETSARFSLGLSSAGAIFLTVLPAALLIVALLMAIGVLARSYREGQSYLMPILLLVMLAGFASFLPGAQLSAGTALVPLLNVTLLVHDILVGKAGATQVMVVWAVSLAWAVLGILLAARVFQTEQVLLSGEKPWRDVFRFRRPLRSGAHAGERAGLRGDAPGAHLLRLGARRATWRDGGAHPRLAARLLPDSLAALVPDLPGSAGGDPAAALADSARDGRRPSCSRPEAGVSGRWSGNSSCASPERGPTPTGWASSSASRGASGSARPCSWWRSCRRSPRR